ncbi:hypothetical protein CspeluHIS016_0202070 [Cutaneotrichosporon spelunceum]|uniref:Uncharacterized protein n=1 Tax=Cutaneotrichosporon spelunceum TaxID=1672016 RepID=A0AAD3TQJ4_9TREE|nr:hypothetical protein CspeluHIS016_0202070 [Cutaneotrichosporon spelunceum]
MASPVEAAFRRESAADAAASLPVPDLVHSPPRRASLPFRQPERPALSSTTFAPTYGGQSMVRSISQPVLTGAEHARYTASRAASLGRATGRATGHSLGSGLSRGSSQTSSRSWSRRARLSLGNSDGDVEMDKPARSELAFSSSSSNSSSSNSITDVFLDRPQRNFMSPRSSEPLPPAFGYDDASLPWSPYPSATRAPRPPSPVQPDRSGRRTPSPSTSRLVPTGRVRMRSTEPSPVSARAAALRIRRCTPRFKVREIVRH